MNFSYSSFFIFFHAKNHINIPTIPCQAVESGTLLQIKPSKKVEFKNEISSPIGKQKMRPLKLHH